MFIIVPSNPHGLVFSGAVVFKLHPVRETEQHGAELAHLIERAHEHDFALPVVAALWAGFGAIDAHHAFAGRIDGVIDFKCGTFAIHVVLILRRFSSHNLVILTCPLPSLFYHKLLILSIQPINNSIKPPPSDSPPNKSARSARKTKKVTKK